MKKKIKLLTLNKIKLSWLKSHWYPILVFLILLIATFFRFYHFSTRWNLAFDQARDALVAREVVRQRKIPLLGPFASGANVVSGPQWYWVIALFTWFYPRSVLSPWVGLAILYVFFVFLMIKIAEQLGDRKLGLLAGLIAAFSPLQIRQGVSLTNPSLMVLASVVSLWALIKYLKTKKSIFAFVLGTAIAAGINIHLQGIGLLFLIPVVVILGWKHSWKAIFSFLFGFLIQCIPLIIFDLKKDFYNSRGLIDYLLYGQFKTWMPNRWLTYVFSFWPDLWSKIAGGNKWLSYVQGIGIGVLIIQRFFKKKLSRPFLAHVISFVLIFVSLRYYRGPRFESYYVFTHPFVLFLSAWFIWQLYHWKKALAGLLLLFILIGSLKMNLAHYRVEKNTTYPLVKIWEKTLVNNFPGKKFAVYDYNFSTKDKTTSLALALAVDDLIDDDGVRIGISRSPETISEKIFFNQDGYFLTDISEIKQEGDNWAFLNPSEVWKATEEWWYDDK